MIYLFTYGVAFVATIGLLWATGRVLGRWLGPTSFERLTPFVLGLAFWTAWAFLLAALGWLRPWALLPPVLAVAYALATDPPRLRIPRPTLATSLAGLALAGLLLPLALLAASPPISWDANTYHLTLPRIYLENGGFRPVDFNVYSNWPLNTELLYALALMVSDYPLAKLMHFGFGLLVLLALFEASRTFRPEDRAAGWLASCFFLANGVVAFEMRVAYVELAHAFFFLGAFLYLLRFREVPQDRSHLLLAGLCCGLMAGVKLNGILGVAILAPLWIPFLIRPESRSSFWKCFVLPIVVLWIPWLLKSIAYTGNPVYPLLYGLFDGPDWSHDLSTQLTAWQQGMGMGREPMDYLLLPLRVLLLGGQGYENFDGSLGKFWILLIPLALAGTRHSSLVRWSLLISGLYFVSWSLISQQMRFLVPMLPLLALAGAVSLGEFLDRLDTARDRCLAQGLGVLAALVLVGHVNAPVLDAGYRSLERYGNTESDLLAEMVNPVYRFINTELPADAKLLFLGTNHGFFCHREYLADSFFEASQIRDWLTPAETPNDVLGLLKEREITHLLVDRRSRGLEYPRTLWQLLADEARVQTLFHTPDQRFLVLALR